MSADLRTTARSAEPIGDEFFGIIWADDHESVYPLRHLRDHCPCATCNEQRLSRPGGPSGGPGVSLPVVGPGGPSGPLVLAGHEAVGRYAIRFIWSDRHDTGIFTFELLRALCPCETCEAERTAKAPPGGGTGDEGSRR